MTKSLHFYAFLFALALTTLGASSSKETNPYVTPWLLEQRVERCYPGAVAPWFSGRDGDMRLKATVSPKIDSIGVLNFKATVPQFVFPKAYDLSGSTDVAYDRNVHVAALRFMMETSYVTVLLAGVTAPPFPVTSQHVPTSMHGIALDDERSKVEQSFGIARNSQRARNLVRTAYETPDRNTRLDVYYYANRVIGLVYTTT